MLIDPRNDPGWLKLFWLAILLAVIFMICMMIWLGTGHSE